MTWRLAIAFDPGKITGVAWGMFDEANHLRDIKTLAVTYDEFVYNTSSELALMRTAVDYTTVEVFKLRDNDFTADLTGVRVEGILETWFHNIVWRTPADKSQVPDRILKEHGLWVTGSDVNWEDGRDANDAIIHLLGFVAFNLKHRPTLKKYFGGKK